MWGHEKVHKHSCALFLFVNTTTFSFFSHLTIICPWPLVGTEPLLENYLHPAVIDSLTVCYFFAVGPISMVSLVYPYIIASNQNQTIVCSLLVIIMVKNI
jgi:hypothetical protein